MTPAMRFAAVAPPEMIAAMAKQLETHRNEARPGRLILEMNIPAGGLLGKDWHLQPAAIGGRWGTPLQAKGLTVTGRRAHTSP